MQPGGVSCGVCTLAAIQCIVDGKMDARRNHKFAEAKLLRDRAKWACELLLHPAPTSDGSSFSAAGGRSAGAMTKFDDAEADDAKPL